LTHLKERARPLANRRRLNRDAGEWIVLVIGDTELERKIVAQHDRLRLNLTYGERMEIDADVALDCEDVLQPRLGGATQDGPARVVRQLFGDRTLNEEPAGRLE